MSYLTFLFKFVKIRFFSPVIFQRSHIETPWRISSDYIIRALTHAYSKIYDVNEWLKFLEEDVVRVSSLILVSKNKLYLPDFGVKGYVSSDGGVIDFSELVIGLPHVRVSRIEGTEPTPFEDYQLLTPKYEWGLIAAIREEQKYHGKVFKKVLASLRLLGDLGLGARKSRGSGRFQVVQVEDLSKYDISIAVTGMGKLISRYMKPKENLKSIVAHNVYVERTRICYGETRLKEFLVIAEGSKLQINDNGTLEFFQNDLLHNVPLYYRPLLIIT